MKITSYKSLLCIAFCANLVAPALAQSTTAATTTTTAPATAAIAVPITDTYVRLYVMYYTVSSFELLADLIDKDMSTDPAVLSTCNVILISNTPSALFSKLPVEFQNYINAILPLEQNAATSIAALADGDSKGLQDISQKLIEQKQALSSSYPNATAQLNDMEAATASITKELGLDQFQESYAKAHEKELQSDAKAMAPMLRAMAAHIMTQIKAMPASAF